MNVIQLTFSFKLDSTYSNGGTSSLITIFTEPITSILISRFLIDLQDANESMMHQHSRISSVGSIQFGRMIGALGSTMPAPGEAVHIDSLDRHEWDDNIGDADNRDSSLDPTWSSDDPDRGVRDYSTLINYAIRDEEYHAEGGLEMVFY
ncbi:hypothetical protein C8Q74DRAFT_306848 [Fomes fomentarius]|nr:hypothetical protein C8Q74DRAFT_306848 [Fomes fomentarius]